VEFSSLDVAEIVAETMDGYLIHPHRMVCKVVEVDENVWKGANRVFKKIPWVRINREKLEAKRTQEGWEGIVQRDEEKTRKRAEKIKELGIEYDAPVRGEKRKAEKEIAAPESEKKGKTQKVGKEKNGKRVASASKEKSKSKA
jgi:nucleolar protein 15